MFRYREHRGGLSESMETQIELESMADLIDHIKNGYLHESHIPKNIDDIEIEFYCYDDRIKQDCFMVSLDGYGVYGFTDRMPEK